MKGSRDGELEGRCPQRPNASKQEHREQQARGASACGTRCDSSTSSPTGRFSLSLKEGRGIKNTQAAEQELNSFLSTHRVLTVRREFVSQGENSFWSLAVEYLEGTASFLDSNKNTVRKPRIDYKEVLNENDFAMFSKLREIRKQTAEKEGIPVYAVFTNEQLAEIVKRKVKTKTEMRKIEGIGEAKVEKYGTIFFNHE